MYTSNFPGSIPEYVMRTGTVAIFDPRNARQDITEQHVENTVRIPVGMEPGVAQYGPPPQAPMNGFGDAGSPSWGAIGLVTALAAGVGFATYTVVRRRRSRRR